MKIETVGPLIFWTVMFIVGAAIKFSAFGDFGAWLHLAPEAALWSSGILFSLSVSEQTYSGARLESNLQRLREGSGYTVNYKVTIPNEPGFTSKFIYLFLVSMAFWIFCVLLSGYAEKIQSPSTASGLSSIAWDKVGLITLSYILAAAVVTTALRSLYEVTK